MAIINIPITDNPDKSFTVILDNVAYDVRLQWNGRDESWYLYCGRANRDFLFKTKITTAADILKKYRSYEDCPKGMIKAIDLNKRFGRIQRDSFSSGRFKLIYLTQESVEALDELGVI
jgi:hypothetical protein